MIIRITRISSTHHIFAYRLDEGEEKRLEFETKSFLFHDFLHFAVETEAGLKEAFYGRLAKGKSYEELSEQPMVGHAHDEAVLTEYVVGALTGVIKNGVTPEDFLAGMKNLLDAYHVPMPMWLTKEFVLRVQERMRRLLGEWQALPFGETITLTFSL